jgi:hypothetical protein
MVPTRDLLKESADTEDFTSAEERRRRADDFAAAQAKVQAVAAKIARDKGKNKAEADTGSGTESCECRQLWNDIQQQAKTIDILMVGKCHPRVPLYQLCLFMLARLVTPNSHFTHPRYALCLHARSLKSTDRQQAESDKLQKKITDLEEQQSARLSEYLTRSDNYF